MYEMQPIYMNAATCKMFLPTWLKVNKFSKTKIIQIPLIQKKTSKLVRRQLMKAGNIESSIEPSLIVYVSL